MGGRSYDSDHLRAILSRTGIWDLINTAISVAENDHRPEFERRKATIIKRLKASLHVRFDISSPVTTTIEGDDATEKSNSGLGEAYNVNKVDCGDIPTVQELLNNGDQPAEKLMHLLRKLDCIEMTFETLQETGIGKSVNRLRKHASLSVQKFVSHLVGKWKRIMDEWVDLHMNDGLVAAALEGGKNMGRSTTTRIEKAEEETTKGIQTEKAEEETTKGTQIEKANEETSKGSLMDPQRLLLAKKRLRERYEAAENAKKKIPKLNSALSPEKNKGGSRRIHYLRCH